MPTKNEDTPSIGHRLNITKDGMYQGVIKMVSGAGIGVDILAGGLRAAGAPISDTPVGGSKWIKERLTDAHQSYNSAIGYKPPAAVDRLDKVLHATGDLAGQIIVPAATAAVAARAGATAIGTKEVLTKGKEAFTYGNSTADAAGFYDDAARAIGRGGRAYSSAYSQAGGIKSDIPLQAAFATSAAGVVLAAPEPAAPVLDMGQKQVASVSLPKVTI